MSRPATRRDGPSRTEIFIIAADGTGERQLTDIAPAPGPSYSHSTYPAWSPDGRRIAFAYSNRAVPPPPASGIYVINADGTDLTQLVAPNRHYIMPSWSPAGDQIIFFRPTEGDHDLSGSGLYIVDIGAEATTPRLVVGEDRSFPESPDWSPVDTRLALALTPVVGKSYVTYGKRGIHTIDVVTGEKQQITHTGYAPSWSPDGLYLAFEFGQEFNYDVSGIAITDISGRTQWVVTDDGSDPQWRPGQPTGSP